MTTVIHTDVIDNGLSELIGAAFNIVICQTEPLTLADCTTNKRVTGVVVIGSSEITLVNGANAQSRKIVVPAKTFQDDVTTEVLVGVADLWLAIYDGTRMLLKSDEITNRELLVGSTVLTPLFEYEARQ